MSKRKLSLAAFISAVILVTALVTGCGGDKWTTTFTVKVVPETKTVAWTGTIHRMERSATEVIHELPDISIGGTGSKTYRVRATTVQCFAYADSHTDVTVSIYIGNKLQDEGTSYTWGYHIESAEAYATYNL
jgi:hypothetical protein